MKKQLNHIYPRKMLVSFDKKKWEEKTVIGTVRSQTSIMYATQTHITIMTLESFLDSEKQMPIAILYPYAKIIKK